MEPEAKKVFRKPTFGEAMAALLFMVGIITVGTIFGIRVEILMILSAVTSGLITFRIGWRWPEIEAAISERLGRITPTLLIIWCTGLVIAAMLFSGTIPMIVYYGFQVIDPQYIYVGAFLLCLIMSTATGTSWGSAGTAGVACMGLATGLGVSLPITAGAVISGSIFGDKLSPLSETTNMAPLCAGTGLYTHIHSMMWTTLPPAAICVVAYILFGRNLTVVSGEELPESAVTMMEQMEQIYDWNVLLLLPVLVIVVGALLKFPTVPLLLATSAVAVLLGVFYQGFSLSSGAYAAVYGFTVDQVAPEGIEFNSAVTSLLNRGGMSSMSSVVIICYCGFASASILTKAGLLEVALQPLTRNLNNRVKTMAACLFTSMVLLVAAGTSYVGFIFSAEMYKKSFLKNGMGLPALSRSLEDVGTCMACLVPWGTSGSFYVATLGVSVYGAAGYAQWTILPFLCPIFAMIYAITGIAMFKPSKEEVAAELKKLGEEED